MNYDAAHASGAASAAANGVRPLWGPEAAAQQAFRWPAVHHGGGQLTLSFTTEDDALLQRFGARHGDLIRLDAGQWAGQRATVLGAHMDELYAAVEGERVVRNLKEACGGRWRRAYTARVLTPPRRALSAQNQKKGSSLWASDAAPWRSEHRTDQYIRTMVFCFNDGLLANACLMCGVAVASLEPAAVVTVGFVGLFAGAVSMASAEWVSTATSQARAHRELQLEREHLANYPYQEAQSLRRLLSDLHFSDESIGLITRDTEGTTEDRRRKQLMLHAMVEFGIDPENVNIPIVHHVSQSIHTFVAFAAGACIPLLPWLPYIHGGPEARVLYTLVVVFGVLCAVGAWTTTMSPRPLWHAVARQLLVAVASVGLVALLTSVVRWALLPVLLP